ncbi:hypothetical protein NOI82_24475, partial [Escherichia coli]|uniref:hypothetical protein n=1 Tax=Escherichia coli TaxID=562 RepID=UPI002876F649
GLSGAPGCVTWELILDGYSESSYSATPRFAAARLPWFLYRSQLASLIKTVVKAKSQPQAFSVDKFLRNRSIHADSCRK